MLGQLTPQLFPSRIANQDFLPVFLISVALVTFITFIIPKYFPSINKVHRIAALEGIDEMVRACAKKGRQLNWGCTLEYKNQYLPLKMLGHS